MDATDMPLHLQWQPRPWLMFVALAALIPAAALWGAALADSLGITHLLIYVPIPSTAPSRPERLLLLDAFFTVTLVLPFFAAVSSVLATVAFDLRITSWEVAARVRLPAPPWALRHLLVAVLLLGAMILFIAMAGHLAADCMFGTDCVPG